MQTLSSVSADSQARWQTYPSLQRWRTGLINMTGLSSDEVAHRVDALFHFCVQHEIDPETMAEECRTGQNRVARRTFYLKVASQTPANLIVQSFLVHNGVNVFGDLICMPSTREQLAAEQGQQWISTTDPS